MEHEHAGKACLRSTHIFPWPLVEEKGVTLKNGQRNGVKFGKSLLRDGQGDHSFFSRVLWLLDLRT